MATTIIFVCADCSEMFEEPVQTFIDADTDEIMAPALCAECGHDAEDGHRP